MASGPRLLAFAVTAGIALGSAPAWGQTRPPAPATPAAQPPARPPQTPARPPQTPPTRPVVRPPVTPRKTIAFVTFGGGAQLAASDFSETHSAPLYGEQKTWTADYDIKTGLDLEAGGGYRAWRNLFLGATYSRFHDSRAAAVTAQIPHPFFFNQPRTITGDSAKLSHDENAVHISASWIVPVGRRLEVAVSGGPSIIAVSRPLVDDVEFTETYPYDTAELSAVTVKDASKVAFGAHGGAAVSWLLTPQVGIGGSVRYSRASATLPTPSGGTVSIDAGGLQAAATITFRVFAKPPAARVPARATPPRTPPGARPPAVPDVPVAGVIATAVTTATAPIFLRPDATLTPLRQVPTGTRLRVLEQTADWVHIEFNDTQYGRRIGYVQKAFVRIEGGR